MYSQIHTKLWTVGQCHWSSAFPNWWNRSLASVSWLRRVVLQFDSKCTPWIVANLLQTIQMRTNDNSHTHRKLLFLPGVSALLFATGSNNASAENMEIPFVSVGAVIIKNNRNVLSGQTAPSFVLPMHCRGERPDPATVTWCSRLEYRTFPELRWDQHQTWKDKKNCSISSAVPLQVWSLQLQSVRISCNTWRHCCCNLLYGGNVHHCDRSFSVSRQNCVKYWGCTSTLGK